MTDCDVSISCPVAKDVLLFRSMSGSEALGRLPEYRVQLVSTDLELKISDVLGKWMTVSLDGINGQNATSMASSRAFAAPAARATTRPTKPPCTLGCGC